MNTLFKLKNSLTTNINHILIVNCLDKNKDINSSSRIYEDITQLILRKEDITNENIKNNLLVVNCDKKQDVIKELHLLSTFCLKSHAKPLVLILGHGNKEKGLALPDKSYLDWERLLKLFKKITHASNGDTMIIGSFCHSFTIIEKLDLSLKRPLKLPFSFFYGYPDAISAGDVETESVDLLRHLIKDGGKSLFPKLSEYKFKLYSEYDHIEYLLLCSLMLSTNPEELSKIRPELSLGQIRKNVNTNYNGPRKNLNKKINSYVRDPMFAKSFVIERMYQTERLDYTLESIDNYYKELSNKNS